MPLADLGAELITKGYEIVPIVKDKKYPKDNDWPTNKYDMAWFDKSITNGSAECSVGIKGRHTPAVDIDTTLKPIQDAMFDFLWDNFESDMIRWGRRPLAMFRCDKPFKKKSSKKYYDSNAEKHQLEVLANGQQFVISGNHPDGYTYRTNGEIVPASELPLLDESSAQAIIDHFEMLMDKVDGLTLEATKVIKKPVLVLARWQIDDAIKACSFDVDDYDDWIKMGMILHHQFNGGEEGFDIWNEWSSAGITYAQAQLEAKWLSFASGSGLTFATILHSARQSITSEADKAIKMIEDAVVGEEILNDILPPYKGLFGDVDIERVATAAKSRYRALEDVALGIGVFRGILRAVLATDWTDGWYYVAEETMFLNGVNGSMLSSRGFDLQFANETVGVQGCASVLACEGNLIPKVSNTMYMPSMGEIFTYNGREYYNTYKKVELDPKLVNDRAVDLFLAHCKRVVPDERLRHLMLNFMQHLLTHPGSKIKWAVLLQGSEGDGKGFFTDLMSALLGQNNVKVISSALVSSQFNTWAEGAQLMILNELKITGHNRYEVLNTLKPVITDTMISINPKGLRERSVLNVSNYFCTTNYRDSLPMDEGSRRFLVIFNKCGRQSGAYYDELFDNCILGVKSIHKYLCGLDIHPDFKVNSRAPESHFKDMMVAANKSDLEQLLEDEISSGNPFICTDYVSVSAIRDAYSYEYDVVVSPNVISNKLFSMGYQAGTRHRFKGKRHSFWIKPDITEKNMLDKINLSLEAVKNSILNS